MAVLRFTPPTVSGPFSSTTEGLYDIGFNWSPQQTPASGDTAIVNYGTLDLINTTISGLSLFTVSTIGESNPALSFQDTLLGAGTTLVIDSRGLGASIPITVAFDFENDGTIDVLGQATLSSFAGSATIVNKGALNLYEGFLITSAIENDGVITVGNSSPTAFVSPLTGTGSIVLKPGSTIETTSSVSSGQTFKFVGGAQGNSALQVDSPWTFRSPVSGFSVSDKIVLKNGSSTVTGVNYVASGTNFGSLQISSGGITTTSLDFIGSYSLSDFTVSGTTGGLVVTTSRTDQGIADTSPVYRFFDTSNGTHFFTSSAPRGIRWSTAARTLSMKASG